MSITIDSFKANFDVGARGDHFDISIKSPAGLGFKFAGEDMLRCRSVDMEGSSLGTNTRDQYNSGYEIPDGTVDQGGFVDVTFICDQSFHDRALIEAWHRWIYEGDLGAAAVHTNFRDRNYDLERGSAQIPVMRYLDDYIGTLEVYALRKDETVSLKYCYYDVYPSSYDTQSFGATEDGILEISMSFQYRHYETTYNVENRKPNKNYTEIYEGMLAKQPKLPEASALNTGRKILDSTLDALKVGSRFNDKVGGYLNKLSSLDTAATKYKNLGIGKLLGGG